jgi:hypothetical protein
LGVCPKHFQTIEGRSVVLIKKGGREESRKGREREGRKYARNVFFT